MARNNFLPRQQNRPLVSPQRGGFLPGVEPREEPEDEGFLGFVKGKIDDFLKGAGEAPTVAVTPEIQEPPANLNEIVSSLSDKGDLSIPSVRREVERAGFKRDQPLSVLARLDKAIIEEVNAPRFEIAGVPISAGDINAVATLALGVYLGAQSIQQLFSRIGDVRLRVASVKGIDKWIAERSRGVPPQRQKEAQNFLFGIIAKNRPLVQERATQNLVARQAAARTAKTKVTPQAVVKQAVDDTIKDIENLPEFSKTRTTAVVEGIKAGRFTGQPSPSVRAVQAGVARLGAPAEIRKTLPTEAGTQLLKTAQTEATKKGLDVEAVQGIAPDEFWVAITVKSGKVDTALEWVGGISQKENQAKILEVLGITPSGRRRSTAAKGKFVPFKNIEDAQRFLAGDTSAIATSIQLRGQPKTPEQLAEIKAASDAQLARLKPAQDKIDALQKKLTAAEAKPDFELASKIRSQIAQVHKISIAPTPPTPTAPQPGVTPPEAVVEGIPPQVPTQAVNEIQRQGTIAPQTVSPEDSKYATNELVAPDGPKPPKPPKPVTKQEPEDIFGDITSKIIEGERPDQAALRLHGAAIRAESRRTGIVIEKGSQKLKDLGIGAVKRGQLVPREKDIPALDQLYNALHNPSKVASGEIAVPKGYEAIYKELRALADWDTSSRLSFDPEAATLDDWFFRGWKPPEGLFADAPKGRLGIQPKALRAPRVDATYEEMRGLGFEPLFWNPYQQWGYRHKLGEVYREQIELISFLKKQMGTEFIRPDSGGALPEGWRVPRIGQAFEGQPFAATDPATGEPSVMFTRRWIVPVNVANSLENIYGRRPDIGKFVIGKRVINPLDVIDFLTFVPKRAKLFLSFFQQMDFLNRAGAGSWTGMVDSLMAGKPIQAVTQLARFPKTAWDILGANFNPASRLSLAEQLDSTKPLVADRPGITLKGVSEAGLSTIDVTIFPADMDKLVRQVAENTGIIGKSKAISSAIGDFESAMRRGLFQGVYPAAIITDIQNNIAPIIARQFPESTDAQINGMVAKLVNIKYSVIPPEQSVFQNSFLREVLRRVFFSVGESEGLLRQATGAFHGFGASFWRKHWIGVYLFLIFMAEAIHFASTGEHLPAERYSPIAKDNWGSLPFGYNTQFASPTLPFRGRGDVEVTLDLVGQMDTAFRVLDPGSFLSARTSVPVRATVNQISGTDFYGAPIDDVGPGGVTSRTAQLALDLFAPIGIGGIATEALRQVPGAGEIIPEGESRLGMLGLGVQATGVNLRAEVTRGLLDRFAKESGLLKDDGTPVQSWNELEPSQKDKVLENEELVAELASRSETSVERGLPGAAGYASLQALDQRRIVRGEALVGEFDAGIHDPNTFREEVTKLKLEMASRKAQVDEDFQLFQDTQELPEDPNKRALVEYYTIFDNAKRQSGVIDWDRVDQLENQLRAKWTPAQEAYVDRNTGLTEWGPRMQEYIDAQALLKESGYWEISGADKSGKRLQLRRVLPGLDDILQKWYGYKPVAGRTTTPGFREKAQDIISGTQGQTFRPREPQGFKEKAEKILAK